MLIGTFIILTYCVLLLYLAIRLSPDTPPAVAEYPPLSIVVPAYLTRGTPQST